MNTSRIKKKFGLAVRGERNKLNISQEELGFKSGLHRTYIGSLERGERNISIENIKKISKALKIPAFELMKKADL